MFFNVSSIVLDIVHPRSDLILVFSHMITSSLIGYTLTFAISSKNLFKSFQSTKTLVPELTLLAI